MAGAQDSQETLVGQTGDAYFAPVGTALPANATAAPNAAFYKVGYLSEDGPTFRAGQEVQAYPAWQKKQPIRKDIADNNVSISFALLQWNAENIKFAFGGGKIVDLGASGFRYDPPAAGDSLAENALILDVQDGGFVTRLVIPRGNIEEDVETQFQRSSMATLPITFSVIAPDDGALPWNLYSSDPAFHS